LTNLLRATKGDKGFLRLVMGSKGQSDCEYDVLVIGAGLSGIYSLYRMRELGLKARVLEAGSGEGGTWWWYFLLYIIFRLRFCTDNT
jgi:heterodisulfide reductase subunit A-like polyferredoxin